MPRAVLYALHVTMGTTTLTMAKQNASIALPVEFVMEPVLKSQFQTLAIILVFQKHMLSYNAFLVNHVK